MKAKLVLAVGLLAASVAIPAWGRDGAAKAAKVDELSKARGKVATRALETKGKQRQELMMKQRKLDRLIDDLESGRHVDPSEINRVLPR